MRGNKIPNEFNPNLKRIRKKMLDKKSRIQ